MFTTRKLLFGCLAAVLILSLSTDKLTAQDLPSPTATIGDPIVGAGDAFSGFAPGPAASPTPSGEAYVPGEYVDQTTWSVSYTHLTLPTIYSV